MDYAMPLLPFSIVYDYLTNFIKDIMEVFMDDFSIWGTSFHRCLHIMSKVLQRYKDTNLVMSLEKGSLWHETGLS